MGDKLMGEKRKFRRVSVDAIMMYQIQKYPDGTQGTFHKIGTPISVNISVGGLQIDANQKLPIGTKLQIIISIVTTPSPIELNGKVMWVKPYKDNKLFKIGIQFVDFNDKLTKQLISNYIKLKD